MNPGSRAATITLADDPSAIGEVQVLFRAYLQAFRETAVACFASFETEIDTLPGAYAGPVGALLLARLDGLPAGVVALRASASGAPGEGEMKRLWVRPEARGHGIGRLLVAQVIETARQRGFHNLFLQTIPVAMPEAVKLYRALGFQPAAGQRPEPGHETLWMPLGRRTAGTPPGGGGPPAPGGVGRSR